jgi:Protein of unknown function (DUF2510)
MPSSGWYPDPDGTPDRYRYWDGSSWSTETTDDPRRPAPAAATPPERRSLGIGLLLGVLTAVVAILVAAVLLFRERPTADDPLPASSVSAWDDSSPTDRGTLATPSGTGSAPCAPGAPHQRGTHPSDGWVHGGNLSFPEVERFEPPGPEPRLSFAYDVAQQYLSVNENPGWIAQLAVGQLRAADGFTGNAEGTAQRLVQCVIDGAMYAPYRPSRHDWRSEAVAISGKPGWVIETDIRVAAAGLPLLGDSAVFIVVQDGQDWGLFFGAVPIGNADLEQILTDTVASLRAS